VAPLAVALAYPSQTSTFAEAELTDALNATGLSTLTERLHEEAHWNRTLSIGEQQRLAIARAILQKPDFLFLDEATASLDEAAEAALYALLHRRLKDTTIISIGHRSTLGAFHARRYTLTREGETHRLQEIRLEPAAE
jgi:putative ATP-binding cassette transporter